MASAVAGFIRTFVIDEPMGCYDDFEHADAFVLWGSNMAEMHPILWTRLTDRRLSAPETQVVVLSTYRHRCYDLADIEMTFTPQSDLAILNAIARHIIRTDRVNRDFVGAHVNLKRGNPDIGYGLRPEHPLEQAAENADAAGGFSDMTFEDFAEFLEPYTFDYAEEISGVPADRIEALAEIYADPGKRVMSLWTMGVNQHTRGVWVNNMIYNLHLLTGKIAELGNSPFSLTGQPSACGTAREVGTFAHRLPADRLQPRTSRLRRGGVEAARGHCAGLGRRSCGAAEPQVEGRRNQRLLDPGEQQPSGRPEPLGRDLSRLSQPRQLHPRLGRLSHGDGAGRRPRPAHRHSEAAMDFSRQSPRAVDAHERLLGTGEATCIDCHKGIAHSLPEMPLETAMLHAPMAKGSGPAMSAGAGAIREYIDK